MFAAMNLRPRAGRSASTVRNVLALVLREVSTRYGRSPGGYIWAVLEPLGTILILSFGFSLLIRTPSLGTSFLLFYATAHLPFSLYQSIAQAVSRSINFSRALLHLPAVSWIDAVFARFLLNALTGILVGYVLFTGILVFVDARVVLDPVPMAVSVAMTIALGFGIGVFNCALVGLVPAWDLLWSILTRPLFLASGVIFLIEDMPRTVQQVLWWNPLIHITGLMRSGFYPMYAPQYVNIAYVMLCALVTALMGLILLRGYHRKILNR